MVRSKVLVTGSSGFIGRNLLNTKNESYFLIAFEGDLLDKNSIVEVFKTHPDITAIVHLAGVFSGSEGDLVNVNVLGTYNLLDVAKNSKVKKVIFSSTGAVYGEPIGDKSKETDPLNPNTFYGLTKKMAEDVVCYFNKNFSLDYVILRFPNVYGPGNDKGVIYSFLNDIKNKGVVTIYGDGEQRRNFLRVEDACMSILKSIDYPGKSEVFNISTDFSYTLNDLLTLLATKLNFETKNLEANNNLVSLSLDSTKSREVLGFKTVNPSLKISDLI